MLQVEFNYVGVEELRDASQLISAMLKMRDISWLDSVASEIKDTS